MKKDAAIIFLWAEFTGYLHGVLRELGKQVKTLDVVYWNRRGTNSTQYDATSDSTARLYGRTQTSDAQIYDLLVARNPSIIVVSGWMDKGYLSACRRYKRSHRAVKIVAGIDDQWTGSLRQKIGQVYFQLFYRRLFDVMWVSGKPQYSFAQHFGYGINSIISNLYSADTDLFDSVAPPRKRLVYVGRFVKEKALDLLVDAFCRLPGKTQAEWPLVLIGDGDQKDTILSRRNPNIHIVPFMQPGELRQELLRGGVACLTSHKDQWGVVVHEYALMGLPMLLSSGVGAATEFLIAGYNGYMFEKGDVESLLNRLTRFTAMNESQLAEFGANSKRLGIRIDVEISAKSLLSVLAEDSTQS